MVIIKAISVLKASSKYLIIAVLALALLIRMDFVTNFNFPEVKNDQHFYSLMAIQIIEDGVYGYKTETPNAKVPPGFPLFLAAIFKTFGYSSLPDTLDIVRICNALLSTGTVFFIYLIGLRLFNRPAGLLAALLASIYGPSIFVTGLILSENLFLFFLFAAIYFQVRIIQENRPRDHIIAGALAAVATLARPNTIIITIVPYLFLWAQHRKLFLKQILMGAGAFALLMMPWWIRNMVTMGQFILLSEGSGNPFLGGTEPYLKKTIDWNNVDYNHQFELGVERIKDGLKEDPGLWIRWFTVGKTSQMFINTIYVDYYFRHLQWDAYELFQRHLHKFFGYVGITIAAIMPFIKNNFRFLSVHFFMFLGIQLLFIPESRYTLPMMPFLMLILSGAFVELVKWIIVLVKRLLSGNVAVR